MDFVMMEIIIKDVNSMEETVVYLLLTNHSAQDVNVLANGQDDKAHLVCASIKAYIWIQAKVLSASVVYSAEKRNVTMPRILCNRNGAISHLQTETGFV